MNLSAHRISFDKIRQAHQIIDPVFLHTPQYDCEPLSALLGVKLILKVETMNPIRSFKGRGADYLLSQRKDEKHLMCASAGNFGQAMAYACRKRGVKLTVYASTKANPYKIERMRALGAEVILSGEDFDAAKSEAKKVASSRGIPMIEDGLAVETSIGAGTMGLELIESGSLDALLIPLGNGALFNGVARVYRELAPTTKLVAVQAAGAPAMVESWTTGKMVVHDSISTIADGIGVRIPIVEALEDMKPLIDEAITVKEDSILEAMRMIHEQVGVVPEPSAAVGIAALLENPGKFAKQRVATILCGSNLTTQQIHDWLS